mmetsp:Transcript_13410/g.28682  ORF Transcript_13410/g.28682 Transcript_13410/m.28682 type:complete len:286 (-) Transcript_13410:678-1535(-)
MLAHRSAARWRAARLTERSQFTSVRKVVVASAGGSAPPPLPRPSHKQAAKAQLLTLLDDIAAKHGPAAAILPGLPQEKAQVDELLQQLQHDDSSKPLRADIPIDDPDSAPSAEAVDPLLLGDWDLVYASNGTVVTRTGLGQVLLSAGSALPGVGLSNIMQKLSSDSEGLIQTSNEAVFGFGPFGSWQVGIEGVWRNTGDGKTVRVVFDKLRVRPVELLGLKLPDWLPQMVIAPGQANSESRGGAEWVTTYVDEDLRIGRGKTSGNLFLFRRKSPAARARLAAPAS